MSIIPYTSVWSNTRSVLEGTYPAPVVGREVSVIDSGGVMYEPEHIQIVAGDVFGSDSFIPDLHRDAISNLSIVQDSVPYQVVVILLFVFYFLLMLRYGREVMRMVGLIFVKDYDVDRHVENKMPQTEVRTIALICGVLMIGIALVRVAESISPAALTDMIQHNMWWLVAPVAALAIFAIFIIQRFVMFCIGSLTFTGGFFRMLNSCRVAFFFSLTVFGAPTVLLLSLSGGIWAQIFAWIFVGIFILHILCYIVKSFFLFAGQKVSILFWFLYLCAVEVMPFAIPVAIAMRIW